MAQTPEQTAADAAALEKLTRWQAMNAQLRELREDEAALRKELFAHFFPAPVEGANTAPLPGGWRLTTSYPLTRAVDLAQFTNLRNAKVGDMQQVLAAFGIDHEKLPTGLPVTQAMGMNLDDLVKFKPEVNVKPYRELTEHQRLVFELCITTKPGSPAAFEIKPPKAGTNAVTAGGVPV